MRASQSSGRSPSVIPFRKSSGVIGQRLVRAATRLAVVRFPANVVAFGAAKEVWVLYHAVVIFGGNELMEPET